MMENWQFFLQKEGDYAWLPLETPQVEILEGRYQLIAHTSNAGQSVQVNIRHQYEQEDIPQENIQESIRQIGLSGKVEILPPVYLGLGSWSISCHPEIGMQTSNTPDSGMTDSYELEIQVLSQDFDLFEDWNFGDLETVEDEQVSSEPIETPLILESASEPIVTPVDSPVVMQSDEPVLNEPIVTDRSEMSEQPQPDSSAELMLPTFSTSVPARPFRTVSPTELPRPVTDSELPVMAQSPQLPVFSKAKAAMVTQEAQRFRSLSKIQLIAAAVGQRQQPEISSPTWQDKFHSKLNQIAVSAES